MQASEAEPRVIESSPEAVNGVANGHAPDETPVQPLKGGYTTKRGKGKSAKKGKAAKDPTVAVAQALDLPKMRLARMQLKAIKVRNRIREDMGDVDSLAETIREVGNLQPMVVRPDEGTTESGTLVAGERRYRALKSLGVEEIEVRLFDGDREQARMAEAIENIARKPFTPTETWNAACEIEKALRKRLNVEAGKRMPAGAGQMDETLGRMFNMDASTFSKLRKVMETHKKAPKKWQPVVDEMDRKGSVDPAFKAVKAHTTRAKNPQQQQSPADLKRRKCEDADRALGELVRALDEIHLGHKYKKVLTEIKEDIYDKIPKVE